MAWYIDDFVRWQHEQNCAKAVLEECEAKVDNAGHACIEGIIELCSEHGNTYDFVRIRIVYPDNFPSRNRPPSVYLVSHRDRWRNVPDSHIEGDWKLCLFVPGESGIDFKDDCSLSNHLAIVHTFLLKQRIFQKRLAQARRTGAIAEWPGPQRSHGLEGIREAVRERGRIGRNELCPCGSGLKFKKCHYHLLNKGN